MREAAGRRLRRGSERVGESPGESRRKLANKRNQILNAVEYGQLDYNEVSAALYPILLETRYPTHASSFFSSLVVSARLFTSPSYPFFFADKYLGQTSHI